MTALEARIRAIEGVDLYDLIQAAKICLVPNVVLPKKFRVPEFIKYTGTQCPMINLKSYYNKMTEVVHDEKLLMHFFQYSLSGAALSWYMRLDNTKIRRWKAVCFCQVQHEHCSRQNQLVQYGKMRQGKHKGICLEIYLHRCIPHFWTKK
jgi:hypothetical protein